MEVQLLGEWNSSNREEGRITWGLGTGESLVLLSRRIGTFRAATHSEI